MNKAFVALVGVSALAASTVGVAGGYHRVARHHRAVAPAPVDHSVGFYVNGNLGYGHYNVNTDDLKNIPGVKIERNSIAWSAVAGYQFNPYIAVEGGYMVLPFEKVTIDNAAITGGAATGSTTVKSETSAITFAAKAIYPINEQIDVFGKAGLAYLSQKAVVSGDTTTTATVSNDKHHITPLFGLGVDYSITQNWAVTVQGITTLKSDDEFPATYTGLVGVTYKFG